MLEQLMIYLHNWFDVSRHPGTYTIADGILTGVSFLLPGQYYRIKGSVFSDGLHKYGELDGELQDETFTGEIWALAPPKAVIALAEEIAAWVDKYGAAADSPYASESFGGYSYTKASGSANTAGGASLGTWQGAFANRLNAWRKVAEL